MREFRIRPRKVTVKCARKYALQIRDDYRHIQEKYGVWGATRKEGPEKMLGPNPAEFTLLYLDGGTVTGWQKTPYASTLV